MTDASYPRKLNKLYLHITSIKRLEKEREERKPPCSTVQLHPSMLFDGIPVNLES
jgi:hypothetical protein